MNLAIIEQSYYTPNLNNLNVIATNVSKFTSVTKVFN